eukprot:gnl/Chilomastix_cuspidata/617.p2 GENE.gnl/Chilomastix_cuspidata/617~~gnl/Chilomastix_cuspidata/617.p2  ORF type:complete len:1045 (+),score=363.23 gnl/Chilomastix_cuspidata/617:3586-6720(+)
MLLQHSPLTSLIPPRVRAAVEEATVELDTIQSVSSTNSFLSIVCKSGHLLLTLDIRESAKEKAPPADAIRKFLINKSERISVKCFSGVLALCSPQHKIVDVFISSGENETSQDQTLFVFFDDSRYMEFQLSGKPQKEWDDSTTDLNQVPSMLPRSRLLLVAQPQRNVFLFAAREITDQIAITASLVTHYGKAEVADSRVVTRLGWVDPLSVTYEHGWTYFRSGAQALVVRTDTDSSALHTRASLLALPFEPLAAAVVPGDGALGMIGPEFELAVIGGDRGIPFRVLSSLQMKADAPIMAWHGPCVSVTASGAHSAGTGLFHADTGRALAFSDALQRFGKRARLVSWRSRAADQSRCPLGVFWADATKLSELVFEQHTPRLSLLSLPARIFSDDVFSDNAAHCHGAALEYLITRGASIGAPRPRPRPEGMAKQRTQALRFLLAEFWEGTSSAIRECLVLIDELNSAILHEKVEQNRASASMILRGAVRDLLALIDKLLFEQAAATRPQQTLLIEILAKALEKTVSVRREAVECNEKLLVELSKKLADAEAERLEIVRSLLCETETLAADGANKTISVEELITSSRFSSATGKVFDAESMAEYVDALSALSDGELVLMPPRAFLPLIGAVGLDLMGDDSWARKLVATINPAGARGVRVLLFCKATSAKASSELRTDISSAILNGVCWNTSLGTARARLFSDFFAYAHGEMFEETFRWIPPSVPSALNVSLKPSRQPLRLPVFACLVRACFRIRSSRVPDLLCAVAPFLPFAQMDRSFITLCDSEPVVKAAIVSLRGEGAGTSAPPRPNIFLTPDPVSRALSVLHGDGVEEVCVRAALQEMAQAGLGVKELAASGAPAAALWLYNRICELRGLAVSVASFEAAQFSVLSHVDSADPAREIERVSGQVLYTPERRAYELGVLAHAATVLRGAARNSDNLLRSAKNGSELAMRRKAGALIQPIRAAALVQVCKGFAKAGAICQEELDALAEALQRQPITLVLRVAEELQSCDVRRSGAQPATFCIGHLKQLFPAPAGEAPPRAQAAAAP